MVPKTILLITRCLVVIRQKGRYTLCKWVLEPRKQFKPPPPFPYYPSRYNTYSIKNSPAASLTTLGAIVIWTCRNFILSKNTFG